MRFGAALAVMLTLSFVSSGALANGAGLAGYTGKPTTLAPQGESCNQCHSGGTAPQVSITGPASLAAGESADYTLVVATGQSTAGGGVAATDGVALVAVANGGFRDSFGEMVQSAGRGVAQGQATFRFRATAPMTGTTFRLWAVGLASNGNGVGGDRAAHVTRDVTVTGGGPAPRPDAGSSSSSGGVPNDGDPTSDPDGDPVTGGSSSNLGGGDELGGGGDDDDEEEGVGEGKRRRGTAGSSEGCSAAPATSSGSLVAAVGVAAALVFSARRRGRR